jgi:UPF0042 nucleotide-binding protein
MPGLPSRTRSRARRKSKRRRSPRTPLVIITGLSGSGKGSVLRTLEDLGYYCVDNLPIALIPTFVDLAKKGGEEVERAALVVDIRERDALEEFPAVFQQLERRWPATLVFVEANEEALLRRFSETRRPHPLGAELPLREGIRRERELLKPIRGQADVVIDTSRFTPHELRQLIRDRFGRPQRRRPLLISLVSFGYRYGLPTDADLVFDLRFLPNPNFVPAFKPLTGTDRRVARYVLSFPQTREFIRRIVRLLAYLIPHYVREDKSYLTIGFGCTGGRHRSVAIARAIADHLRGGDSRIKITHRDYLKAS